MKTSSNQALPSLFVPHGAPTFALQPGEAGAMLASLGQQLDNVKAILLISAHWHSDTPTLSIASRPETIHDYYGFPQALYSIRYPATGAVSYAMEARSLLEEAGFSVILDPLRGLDHGAWIPLRMMFPEADVPVFTLSLQSHLGTAHHFRLGQAIAPLRQAGVVIVGSGNLTHNLMHFGMLRGTDQTPAYVTEFQGWMRDHLVAGDTDALLDYRTQAPGAATAHPTDEHLLPLYVAMGAAGATFAAEQIYSGIEHNMLAMDAYAFHAGNLFQPATH
jgi:4,5-DOPA dioxygenase extradiol